MKKFFSLIKRNMMLSVSVMVALISLCITPPSKDVFSKIDWKTLAILFMLLSILDGFKHENLFLPVIKLSDRIKSVFKLSLFLIFGVFFSSMFVTNDISLIIFVPLTIILFREQNKEKYILPIITLENIAAVRGSLLTPFGSPQNLFLFSQSGTSVTEFLTMMFPLWIGSALLLVFFTAFVFRRNIREKTEPVQVQKSEWKKENKTKRVIYLILFAIAVYTIVSRTPLWPYITAAVIFTLLIIDRALFRRVDYALIGTFFCFFLFSSSVSSNPGIKEFLTREVAGREYAWSILLSQVISNVPASILLQPFSTNLKGLIYGLDTAGLVTVIGSLASVINMRLYTKEYPGRGADFMKTFEIISLAFFAIVCPLQLLLL